VSGWLVDSESAMTFWASHSLKNAAVIPSRCSGSSTFRNPHSDGGGQEKEWQSARLDCWEMSEWQQY